PLARGHLPLPAPLLLVRHPRGEQDVLALHLERHQLAPTVARLEVAERVVGVGEFLGQVDAPAEVALRALGRTRRLGLVLELDAVVFPLLRGIGAVDPQRVLPLAHGILHQPKPPGTAEGTERYFGW